ncbi:cytochrome P450 [Actinophytocola oryzae]|uniref:Cytochrome P450 n=1 Tax=Actinophytocola oryzae TaxID=502181 RepID=A0A4R7W1P1_9PSEU|nr:cytochrome P450 [Actinophytocola oryzae]TDV56493.1 cytochrome P450 [Actinophytocola oryzae]
MGLGNRRRLRRDPLEYVEDLRRHAATDVIRLPGGGHCVGDAALAQVVLRDPEFNADRSGFFGDLLPTRAAQIEVGHAVRNFVRDGMPRYRAALPTAVAQLPATDRWPSAGSRLVYRCLAELLLCTEVPAGTRRLANRTLDGDVMFTAPRMWRRARAEILRGRLVAAVAEEVARRRAQRTGEPRDLLDAVLGACRDQTDRRVAEVHLMMFRAIVAPVGTTLAWSVLLGCGSGADPWPWPAEQVVREALRHRPVPWMLGRTLSRPAVLAGTSFRAGDVVSVSPYLLHHDERHWTEPGAFRPGRWNELGERGSWVPFGAGPFTCAGASVALGLVSEALTALTRDAHLTVTGGDACALTAEGAVPRPFTLHRRPRTDSTPEGGDRHDRDAAPRLQ